MRGELHFDAVVIGAGTAGLVAGDAAGPGRGAASACWPRASARPTWRRRTIDVLGYAPDRVDEPGTRAERADRRPARSPLRAARAPRRSATRSSWFAGRVSDGPLPGYRYVGGLERNQLLPTAVGVLRPSALVPETMAAGEAAAARARLHRRDAVRCATSTPACAPRTCERPAIEARAVSLELKLERADMNALGIGAPLRRPGVARARSARSCRSTLRAEEHVGLPAMLGLRDPHGVLRRPRAPARPPRVRDPDAAAVGAGHAPVRDPARGAARGRRAARARRRGGRPPSATATRVTAVATRAAGHDGVTSGDAGSCSPPAASPPARSSSTRTGSPTSGCSACRCAASRRRASRGSSPHTSTSSRWRGSGSRSTPSCAPRGPRTCSSPAPRCRARCRGGRAPARASRWRAATARRELIGARCRSGGDRGGDSA